MRIIGGETAASDLDGDPGPVRGPGPLEAAAGGRTVPAGPALIPLAAAAAGRTLVAGPHHPDLIDAVPGGDVTVLVRGLPDAEALARRYAGRPGVTVLCGSPEKLAGEPPFDTVLALDGLDRLPSPDGADLSWADTLDLLLAARRPGGRLALAVENTFGVHRLAALHPGPDGGDPTRPRDVAALRQRIGEPVTVYAAYPSPVVPALLVDEATLADPARRGVVEAALARAWAPAGPVPHDPAASHGLVLRDPVALAIDAVRHGLGAALAPAWVLVTGTPVPPLDGPDGRTLADHVAAACGRHDMPEVRAWLRSWRSAAPGVPAGQIVVRPDGGLAPLAPAGDPATALRDLAALLIRAGHAEAWPAVRDETDLAGLLAAMAGEDPAPAIATGKAPAATEAGPAQQSAATEAARVPALADVLAERDRLARLLDEAEARHAWYEQALTEREDLLKRNRRLVRLLSGTPTARAAAACVEAARLARRALRRGR